MLPGVSAYAFEPAIAVDKRGTVGVIWYDLRNDRPGDAALTADVWLAHSHNPRHVMAADARRRADRPANRAASPAQLRRRVPGAGRASSRVRRRLHAAGAASERRPYGHLLRADPAGRLSGRADDSLTVARRRSRKRSRSAQPSSSRNALGRHLRLLGQQAMPIDDRRGHVHELAVRRS
jgi:hypothetical protein